MEFVYKILRMFFWVFVLFLFSISYFCFIGSRFLYFVCCLLDFLFLRFDFCCIVKLFMLYFLLLIFRICFLWFCFTFLVVYIFKTCFRYFCFLFLVFLKQVSVCDFLFLVSGVVKSEIWNKKQEISELKLVLKIQGTRNKKQFLKLVSVCHFLFVVFLKHVLESDFLYLISCFLYFVFISCILFRVSCIWFPVSCIFFLFLVFISCFLYLISCFLFLISCFLFLLFLKHVSAPGFLFYKHKTQETRNKKSETETCPKNCSCFVFFIFFQTCFRGRTINPVPPGWHFRRFSLRKMQNVLILQRQHVRKNFKCLNRNFLFGFSNLKANPSKWVFVFRVQWWFRHQWYLLA